MAIELYPEQRSVNPLVNAGAIAAVSLVQATSRAGPLEQDPRQPQRLRRHAHLTVLEEVYDSEYATAFGNRAIANLLFNYERLYSDPEEAMRVYTRECSVGVSAKDLGMMGATLANGGVNPVTRRRMLPAEHVPELLAIMSTAGFYDESGEWMYTAGLPAKTGVGGGIVAVVPGRFAIAAFSPRLNEAGNSVRSLNAIRDIAGELGVGVFGPNPTMKNRSLIQSRSTLMRTLPLVLLLSLPGIAAAQSADRTGTWEAGVKLMDTSHEFLTGGGGSSLDIEGELAWGFFGGYHINEHFEVVGEITWSDPDYFATFQVDAVPGGVGREVTSRCGARRLVH